MEINEGKTHNDKNSLSAIISYLVNETPEFPIGYIPNSFQSYQKIKNSSNQNKLGIPPRDLWEGYAVTEEEYLIRGNEDVEKMLNHLNIAGFELNKSTHLLDFGCATGRMLRWFANLPYKEAWGCDIEQKHIQWNKENFNSKFNFFLNTQHPHLPFEDNYFDLVYSGSVFTHVFDLADAWLLELRRIVSPKGKLYITFNDSSAIQALKTDWKTHFLFNILTRYEKTQDYEESDAFSLYEDKSKYKHVFYQTKYLKQQLEKWFKVDLICEKAYGFQTAYILTKR